MIENELGNQRRTHYSSDLKSSDEEVTVMGWVLGVRGHGNITFVTLRDQKGDFDAAKAQAELVRAAEQLRMIERLRKLKR